MAAALKAELHKERQLPEIHDYFLWKISSAWANNSVNKETPAELSTKPTHVSKSTAAPENN